MHPYLARQMLDHGFWQNLQGSYTRVRTKICPLAIHVLTQLRSYELTRQSHNTRDTRFMLVRATVVV